jgi:hypothetical protein
MHIALRARIVREQSAKLAMIALTKASGGIFKLDRGFTAQGADAAPEPLTRPLENADRSWVFRASACFAPASTFRHCSKKTGDLSQQCCAHDSIIGRNEDDHCNSLSAVNPCFVEYTTLT